MQTGSSHTSQQGVDPCYVFVERFPVWQAVIVTEGGAGRKLAEERDVATAAASALCVVNGANIIRTHNVAAVHDAVRVADAVSTAACR